MSNPTPPLRESTSRDASRELEQVVARFETLLKRGERPSLEAFLPSDPQLRERALLELTHTEMEYRLKAGERRLVEDYLLRHPELGQSRDAVVDLILAEFRLCRRLDPAVGVEEYFDRFPGCREALHARLAEAEGPTVPGYDILGVLGRGGMGVVYKARHLALKRVVALKMVLRGPHADPNEHARLRAEAESVARLQHPNVVQVFDVGEHQGTPFIAFEYVGGGALDRRLAGKPLPAREAAALVETVAMAVDAAHAVGLLHRDLKPANVLLTPDGTPKVGDFGLARRVDVDARQTQSGAVIGTPSYMAPEQAAGKSHEVGPRSDVYGLGAILYGS